MTLAQFDPKWLADRLGTIRKCLSHPVARTKRSRVCSTLVGGSGSILRVAQTLAIFFAWFPPQGESKTQPLAAQGWPYCKQPDRSSWGQAFAGLLGVRGPVLSTNRPGSNPQGWAHALPESPGEGGRKSSRFGESRAAARIADVDSRSEATRSCNSAKPSCMAMACHGQGSSVGFARSSFIWGGFQAQKPRKGIEPLTDRLRSDCSTD